MKEASAFAPGHLTGFFEICDLPQNPLLKGSRGSGVSIAKGVRTRVIINNSETNNYTISINGNTTKDAFVSEKVLGKMLSQSSQPQRVTVEHYVDTPIGAGFGSSGGGALTLALAINKVLERGLSYLEAARIAHIAEIECKTGLGTVFAATKGGFGVLYKPGGPGIGKALKYKRSEELAVVYTHLGPIPTKEALSDMGLRYRINKWGGIFIDEILDNLTPERFMELSRRFTEHIGLVTPRLRRVLDKADENGFPCAMVMFGEAAFSLVSKDEAPTVADVLEEAIQGNEVFITRIEDRPARLI